MSALNSREKVIQSLLGYLPSISDSLNKIVNKLQEVINGSISVDDEAVKQLIKELGTLIPILESVIEEVPLKSEKTLDNSDIMEQYQTSLKTITIGIAHMIRWMENNKETDVILEKAINILFDGGQQIIKLVNILTEK